MIPRLSGRTLLAIYLTLLVPSSLVRWERERSARASDAGIFTGSRNATPVLLLASAGEPAERYRGIAEALADSYQVLVQDDAQARNDVALTFAHQGEDITATLDQMTWPGVDLVAVGTSGGTAIALAAAAPGRIRSLTLVSASGVEEFDLLGEHHLNLALRHAELGAFWAARNLIPHFGAFDGGSLDGDAARVLAANDRRPVRAALGRWNGPTLILQPRGDPTRPVATATEHARLVPQAELRLLGRGDGPGGIAPEVLTGALRPFLASVRAQTATTRETAAHARIIAAAAPFDARGLASAQGVSLFVVLALLALIPLLSEDLACVAAGVLAARGSIPLVPGIIAVYAGIVFGDQVLYLLGRSLGRAIVTRRPMRWLLTPEDLDRATEWFGRKGMGVVLTSRFLPGTRFPVYVAAGVLRAGFVRYALWLMVIGAIWTPALVGASYLAARSGRDLIESMPGATWVWAVLGVVGLAALGRWTTTLFTPEGRARVAAFWQRRLGGT